MPGQRCWRWSVIAVALALLVLAVEPARAERPGIALPGRSGDEISANAEDLGLVDNHTYLSPQFGIEVTWSDAWQADAAEMESDTASELDRVSVISHDARFQAFFVKAYREDAESYADRFVAFRGDSGEGACLVGEGVHGDVVWLAYRYEEDGDDVFDLVEIRAVREQAVIQVVEVLGWQSSFDEAFATASGEIEIDGKEPFQTVSGWPEQPEDDMHPSGRGC